MSNNGQGAALAEVAKKKAAARAAGSGTETGDDLLEMDLHEMQGNQYMADMLKKPQQQDEGAAKQPQKLPDELRWRMLASNDVRILAGLIFANSSPTDTLSMEMMAIGSVFYNQWEDTLKSKTSQKEFGPPNFDGLAFELNRDMPIWYDPKRMNTFGNAARFGDTVGDSMDLKTAAHAVDLAERLIAGQQLLPQKFMYMDIQNDVPNKERGDPTSMVKYGRFYFWEMKEGMAGGKGDQNASTATVMESGSDSADPKV